MTHGEPLGRWERFLLRFQPTPQEEAQAELKDAELAALRSVSMAEYAALRVQIHTLTAQYHQGRISRLQSFLAREDHHG